jgi:nitrogen-specific signal transduction histidine kinase
VVIHIQIEVLNTLTLKTQPSSASVFFLDRQLLDLSQLLDRVVCVVENRSNRFIFDEDYDSSISFLFVLNEVELNQTVCK